RCIPFERGDFADRKPGRDNSPLLYEVCSLPLAQFEANDRSRFLLRPFHPSGNIRCRLPQKGPFSGSDRCVPVRTTLPLDGCKQTSCPCATHPAADSAFLAQKCDPNTADWWFQNSTLDQLPIPKNPLLATINQKIRIPARLKRV